MVTPWTIPKLVTWRVKDWASCFLAFKLPLDDDDDRGPMGKMVYEMKEEKRSGKKKRRQRNGDKKRERKLSLSPTANVRNTSVSSGNRRLSWPPHVSDEDFIVFCFGEDGALDVVKEGKREEEDDWCLNLTFERSSSRIVGRKLSYGDPEARREDNSTDEKRLEENIPDVTVAGGRGGEEGGEETKGEEEQETEEEEGERIYPEDDGSIRRSYQVDARAESSDSIQSDASRGSFAFPVLGREWLGSPVQMPKPEDLHLKKPKSLSLGFQCCRF